MTRKQVAPATIEVFFSFEKQYVLYLSDSCSIIAFTGVSVA